MIALLTSSSQAGDGRQIARQARRTATAIEGDQRVVCRQDRIVRRIERWLGACVAVAGIDVWVEHRGVDVVEQARRRRWIARTSRAVAGEHYIVQAADE